MKARVAGKIFCGHARKNERHLGNAEWPIRKCADDCVRVSPFHGDLFLGRPKEKTARTQVRMISTEDSIMETPRETDKDRLSFFSAGELQLLLTLLVLVVSVALVLVLKRH